MATIAEQLIEQGIERGIEQGELRGKRELLLRQLRHRFGEEVSGEAERRVATATCELIDEWAGRVLSARTLAEVLTD